MPRYSKSSTKKRRMRGGSILSWIRTKALPFLKKHKIVSRVASGLAGVLPPQYSGIASNIGKAASAVGYGRRRMRYGGALRLAGSGMRM